MLGIAKLSLERNSAAITLPNVVKSEAGRPDTNQSPTSQSTNPESHKKEHCLCNNTKPFLYLKSAIVMDQCTSQNNPMPAAWAAIPTIKRYNKVSVS